MDKQESGSNPKGGGYRLGRERRCGGYEDKQESGSNTKGGVKTMAGRLITNSYNFVHSVIEAKIIRLFFVNFNNNQLLKRRLLISRVHL